MMHPLAATSSAGHSAGDRPRVVVVAQGPPAQGGIATFASTIAGDPVLAETFEVVLLNTTRRAVRRAGTLSVANLWHAVADAGRVFGAARRAQVVHVQTALMPLLPLLRALLLCAAARAAGARVLCHVHSGRVNSGRDEAFAPGRPTRVLLRGLRVAHAVLTVSQAGTATLRRLVPGARVETVDNAVDVTSFATAPLDGDPPVVLFLGTLSRRKGLGDLAAAVHRLHERATCTFDLRVVGGANEVGEAEANALRTALRNAGFEHALMGPLTGDALRAALRAADVFVLPSHWEGQPIAILEAMATGLPVVATRVGAVPDVVRDGVDGILLEPHDVEGLTGALATLLLDDGLRRRMGRAARERVTAAHDLSQLRARLAALYEEMAGAHR